MKAELARSALRVALPRSGPLGGVRGVVRAPAVERACIFRHFDVSDCKIFFGPRATRDGRRATREALRASATR